MTRLCDLTLQERFERRYLPEPNSGCWIWEGSTYNDRGYGRFSFKGELLKATHVSLELDGHPKPDGETFALHKCDNPYCVNPNHLFWGTHSENIKDAVAKNRHASSRATHCKRGHEFTEENTRHHDGKRHCRMCATLRARDKRKLASANGAGLVFSPN